MFSLPGSYLDGGFQDSQCMSSIMIWQLHFSQSQLDEEAQVWFRCQSGGQTASQYATLWSPIGILKHWYEPKFEIKKKSHIKKYRTLWSPIGINWRWDLTISYPVELAWVQNLFLKVK